MFFDQLVRFRTVFEHTANQRVGKKPNCRFLCCDRWQFGSLTPGCAPFFFSDGRGTLRFPKLLQRRLEVLRRVDIMLEQELHSAFACFASLTHKATMPQKRPA